MGLSYTQAVLLYEDGQVIFDEGWTDWDQSPILKGAKATFGAVKQALTGAFDGWLNRLSAAEFINLVDEPESIPDLLAMKQRQLKTIAQEQEKGAIYKGFEWAFDELPIGLGWLTELVLVRIPQKFGSGLSAWLEANPEYAAAIGLHGIMSFLTTVAYGEFGLYFFVIGVVMALASSLIRKLRGVKPVRIRKQKLTGLDYVGTTGHIEELPEMYRWLDNGDPLDEGVLDNIWGGASSALKFDGGMIRAWAQEKKKAAEEGRAPDIETVEGLTQELAAAMAQLPDELEKAGVDPNSRSFKLGMASTRILSSILNAAIAPFWSVITSILPGLKDLELRYGTLPLRMGLAMLLLIPLTGGIAAALPGGSAAGVGGAMMGMLKYVSGPAVFLGAFAQLASMIRMDLTVSVGSGDSSGVRVK